MNSYFNKPASRALFLYFAASYLFDLYLCTGFAAFAKPSGFDGWFFVSAVTVTYPLIYLLPLIVLTVLYTRVTAARSGKSRADLIFIPVIILANALLSTLLYADVRLYDLFGFHINAFVINLLVTPGGIESMGGGPETNLAVGLVIIGILALHILAFLVARRLQNRLGVRKRSLLVLGSVFIMLTLSERVVYGISDSQLYEPVLRASTTVPLYNEVTFRSLMKKLGFGNVDRHDIRLKKASGKLRYPLAKIEAEEPDPPPNIIWIVAESLRWDMLSPDIMPNTYAQSRQGWRFNNHYSGGNGTRQGLFSLFYGIYGSYWDSFLNAGRSPLFLDLLQSRGYQLDMFTSASFTYPEFDRTMFANIPSSRLHQIDNSLSPWERDKVNTQEIIDTIKDRDKQSPFMIFTFYESTHARYDFPEDSALRKPYLENLNYATMSRKSLAPRIDELKNRYINASHFMDSEFGKIFATLSQEDLWKNTIVMVTGDHGEEFMENNFWGHNSGFSEHQIKTPMVLWLPGKAARVIEPASSHMDIVPTILPLLGVINPISDYSLGVNLVATTDHPYLVVSDWAGVAFLGGGYKFTMPFDSSLSSTNQLFDSADKPVTDVVPFLSAHRGDLAEILENLDRFTMQ